MKYVVVMLIIVMSVLPARAQQESSLCEVIAPELLSELCADLGTGEICVAAGSPGATLREDLALASAGDRVSLNAVESIVSQSVDAMRLHLPANLDGDDSIQGLLIGSTTLTNLVPNVGTQDAVTVDRARVRSTPDTTSDSNIVAVLDPGTQVTAAGRDASGDWVQIRFGDGAFGWTAAFLLRVEGDISSLPVGQADAPVFSPMQSFTLAATAAGECAPDGLPPGMLLYSEVANSRLTINGAEVTFDGVLYAMPVQQVGRPAVRFELYAGRAVVQTEQGVQFLVPGSASIVVVSPELTTPLDAPLEPLPTSDGLAALLSPLAAELSAGSIQVLAEPVQGGQMDAQMLALFAPDGLLPGQYRLTNLVVDTPTPLEDFSCALGSKAVASGDWADLVVPQVGTVQVFSPDMGEALLALYQVDVLPDVQINGASLNDHNNPIYRTIPEANGESAARTVVVNSLTSFTYIESWAVRDGEATAACYNQFTWEWIAP